MHKNTKNAAIFLLLLFLLTGCANSNIEQANSTQVSSEKSITITDLAGVTHTFQKPLDKVAVQWSCAGGPFMTMSAILGDDIAQHLACMDHSPQKYRADIWEQCVKDVPALKDVPIIGSVDDELNLEGVLASGAEAFICPLELKKLVDESVKEKLSDVGIPVIYVDFHQETVENHTASTLLLGKLFDKEKRAQEIVDFYTSHRENVTHRIDAILKKQSRPNIYIEVGMMGPSEMGNSFNNQYSWGGIAYTSGANNIGDGIISNTAPLDPEYILNKNPDKIVFTGAFGSSVPNAIHMGYNVTEEETLSHMSAFFDRPGWKELKAFKSGEIFAIHHGMAREMYDSACFEFFAKICFPDEFEDLDPLKTLQDYYSRFMPYQLNGLWFINSFPTQ